MLRLNVLDAVRLSGLPRPTQVAAIAALLRGRPAEQRAEVDAVIRMLVEPAEVARLTEEVEQEVRRQRSLSSDRKKNRTRTLDLLQMTGMSKHQRLNRLCPSIFGPPEAWGPFDAPFDPSGRAVFNWLKRDISGAMISGVDRVKIDECVTGFVIRCSRTQPTLYATLPTRAGSYRDLMMLLGLPSRFLDGRPVSVDWSGRKFILSETSALPWVYP